MDLVMGSKGNVKAGHGICYEATGTYQTQIAKHQKPLPRYFYWHVSLYARLTSTFDVPHQDPEII